jgi:hypothetical protein
MTTQERLFYEDIFDVLRAAVQAAGGAKPVAGKLWPHKPVAEAHRELLDCLNRERPRKFCPEEVLAILKMAREAGFHGSKHWIDQELGYEPTKPLDPQQEESEIAAAIKQHADASSKLAQRIEGFMARNAVKAIK